MADAFMANRRKPIIELAAKHRLPVVYPRRIYVADGGIMGYGTDVVELFRNAAQYVDRILKGAHPGRHFEASANVAYVADIVAKVRN